ncbi:hypothetical protein Btru_015948 [Bulinus truncatus]|nr:hypothetical protein Btru_015948 [Bulinus truncatus]
MVNTTGASRANITMVNTTGTVEDSDLIRTYHDMIDLAIDYHDMIDLAIDKAQVQLYTVANFLSAGTLL